jgi:uncharacterized protein (TIGR03435 family)
MRQMLNVEASYRRVDLTGVFSKSPEITVDLRVWSYGCQSEKRIVRMMNQRVVCKLNPSRKMLLNLTGIVAMAMPAVFGLVHVNQARAQTVAGNPAQNLAGAWQGTLHVGKDLRIVIKISKADGGGYSAVLYSIDHSGQGLPINKTALEGSAVKLTTSIGISYEGKLSSDGKSLVGNFIQGSPLPLILTLATPETAWTIPEPPPVIPPMAANADPSFEVATIKPSRPDQQGKGITVQGRRLVTINTTLADLITFSYGLNPKQIVGAPAWVETDKFDITAQPDGEGAPNVKQMEIMIQKLLADRFKFSFHRDKRELSVYVLSVAKTGSKLTKNDGDPNGLPGLGFRGKLGALAVHNATMDDFTTMMLQGVVLDRPVLNQTGLAGRYDFTLDWTPDDSQFRGMGATIPPPTDSASAPPSLFTAIQEQIGLKLEATKAPAEVFVVDHVEKPSGN